MVRIDERIAEIVVFVGKFDGRLVKDNAFLNAVTLGKASGGNVADDDLKRYDAYFFNDGFAVA